VSGFSPEWLRLREPADHRARDRGLVAQLGAYLNGRETISLVDLGCGTGSNLRALSPALPARQRWRLVDHDPALLDAAREEIAVWAGTSPDISFEAADLSRDLEQVLAAECDVVTAAALFDLVSRDWLRRLVAALARERRAFYTVLIYDGAMDWRPAHPADAAIRAAFNAHQRGDKGFGPAAGPEAGAFLVGALKRAGFEVSTAPSPWVLTRECLPLISAVAEGVAEAAGRTGLVPQADIADWLASRAALGGCTIGHVDILARP
jgi:SAM-dependent methyltransferase